MRTAVVLLLLASLAASQEAEVKDVAERAAAEQAAKKEQEARIAAQKEEQRAVLKKQRELLERRIAVLEKQNPTALGAVELEKLRVHREAIALEMRRLDTDPSRKAGKADVPDIDKLVALAKKGDVPARNALLELKAKIDAVLAAPGAQAQGQVIARNGNVIIINGRQGIQLGGLQPAPSAATRATPREEKAAQPEPLPEEERKRLAEIDIGEQEKRAAELEKTIVDLTRRAMELERRIEELRAQAAAAEKR